ncbi:hypothetical protein NDA01_20765 [Trichocoleus desertorum AS-A10]|uniref:KGK domain-containing protein n=1 Tax=Trichocoleus desertorum TaxID=1481672 RepID=UPI003299A330
MNNNFQELNVQSLDKDAALAFSKSMFKVGEFSTKVKEAFHPHGHNVLVNTLASRGGIPSDDKAWFEQGISCEILRPDAKGWHKGKIRIRIAVEFCPDELEEAIENVDLLNGKAESPLDDIARRNLTNLHKRI